MNSKEIVSNYNINLIIFQNICNSAFSNYDIDFILFFKVKVVVCDCSINFKKFSMSQPIIATLLFTHKFRHYFNFQTILANAPLKF